MLIQLLIQQPQAIGPVLKGTPTWVWGLLAALLALGLSQVRARKVSQVRMTVMPVAMVGFSLWGMASAFGSSPLFVYVLLAWACGAALMLGLVASRDPAAGTRYLADSRSFAVPGSWVPLAIILGIFLTKYVVGVELVMQPGLAMDDRYPLIGGALYGLFSGTFAGRSVRLWRLALSRPSLPITTLSSTNA